MINSTQVSFGLPTGPDFIAPVSENLLVNAVVAGASLSAELRRKLSSFEIVEKWGKAEEIDAEVGGPHDWYNV